MKIDGAVSIDMLTREERDVAMMAGLHLGIGPRDMLVGNTQNCETLDMLANSPVSCGAQGVDDIRDWKVVSRREGGVDRVILELRTHRGVPFAVDAEGIGVFWKRGTLEEIEL